MLSEKSDPVKVDNFNPWDRVTYLLTPVQVPTYM